MKKDNLNKTFGAYIRSLRIEYEIGQRELAQKIGIAPSYLNDIEKNKRGAPKVNIIKKLSHILKADLVLSEMPNAQYASLENLVLGLAYPTIMDY